MLGMENKRLHYLLHRAGTPSATTAERIGLCLLVKMEKGRCVLHFHFSNGRSIVIPLLLGLLLARAVNTHRNTK